MDVVEARSVERRVAILVGLTLVVQLFAIVVLDHKLLAVVSALAVAVGAFLLGAIARSLDGRR